jgi:hypothetical protein
MDKLQLISDEEELATGIKDRLQETRCVRTLTAEHGESTQWNAYRQNNLPAKRELRVI